MRLDLMTWQEVEAYLKTSKTIVVPVGSTEQHGPTGLLGTDSICPTVIARAAADIDPFIIAPTISFGQAQHHLGFAGSVALRPSTLISVIQDVVASLSKHGFTHIYLFNGHGGNVATLEAAMAECYGAFSYRGGSCPYQIKLRSWWELPGIFDLCKRMYPRGHGAHAAPSEVAVTQHAYPDAIKDAPLSPKVAPMGEAFTDSGDFRAQYPDGRMGADPSQASPEDGKTLVDASAKALVKELATFSNT